MGALSSTLPSLHAATTLSIAIEAPSALGFAPALVAFHDGSQGVNFFDVGANAAAHSGLQNLAEGGDTSILAANISTGVDHTTIANGGPFFPGGSNTVTITINDNNTRFSMAAMLLPSNDWFIGNDNDIDISSLIGANAGSSMVLNFSQVYDAGTEADDFGFSVGNPAFGLPGGAAGGTPTTSAISRVSGSDPFSAFANIPMGFDTSTLDFNSQGSQPVAQVTITVVPEPSTTALLGLGGLSLILRRRR